MVQQVNSKIMKKTLILLLFPTLFFAQKTEKVEIYEYQNGIRNLQPSQVIEDNKVYDFTNGIQNLTPTYEYQINLPQLFQDKAIETDIVPVVYESILSTCSNLFNKISD